MVVFKCFSFLRTSFSSSRIFLLGKLRIPLLPFVTVVLVLEIDFNLFDSRPLTTSVHELLSHFYSLTFSITIECLGSSVSLTFFKTLSLATLVLLSISFDISILNKLNSSFRAESISYFIVASIPLTTSFVSFPSMPFLWPIPSRNSSATLLSLRTHGRHVYVVSSSWLSHEPFKTVVYSTCVNFPHPLLLKLAQIVLICR